MKIPFLLLASFLCAAAAAAQKTFPVTSDLGYVSKSTMPSISADGRTVAYESVGTTPGDTCVDIHVRDLDTGTAWAITVCDNSTGGIALQSRNPSLSGDGLWVACESIPTPGAATQAIVHSVPGGVPPEIASVNDLGFMADSSALWPTLSEDGFAVAFQSLATNLVSPALGFNNVWNIYLRDRGLAPHTIPISVNLLGVPSQDGHSQYPAVSAHGRFVAFESVASDLVAPGVDTNGTQDVYVYDRDFDENSVYDDTPGVITLISRDGAGLACTSGGQKPAISADGRFIAFLSHCNDFGGPTGGGLWRVYVCDRDPDVNGDLYDTDPTFELVSKSSLGVPGLQQNLHPSISGDGRYVGFSTTSPLVPNDSIGYDAFVFDRVTQQIMRVSVDSYGSQADGISVGSWYSDDPAISLDGTRVAFSSQATNLVFGDTNGFEDVFAHDVCEPVGIDLGFHLDGTGGLQPVLTACDPPPSGGTVMVRVRDALPSTGGYMAVGTTNNPTPLFGGTVVPLPPLLVMGVTADVLGGFDITLPGLFGVTLFAQCALADPAGPAGWSLSNAIELLP